MYDCNNKSTKKQVNKTFSNMESELVSSHLAQMVKNLPVIRRPRFKPWVGKILWRREWQSIPVFLPGESHGQRSLVGYSLWGRKESDMMEHAHTQTQVSLPIHRLHEGIERTHKPRGQK